MQVFLRAVVVALAACAAFAARAEYPDKPIRFIVPFAAGGGADWLARPVAHFIWVALKQ
jgi:tripartite-type tricarboxylate transporter receptor subunit TctC